MTEDEVLIVCTFFEAYGQGIAVAISTKHESYPRKIESRRHKDDEILDPVPYSNRVQEMIMKVRLYNISTTMK
jgi:hypothetical protein